MTDAKMLCFKYFPRLRDPRQCVTIFTPGYNIPGDTLTHLEAPHYSSPENIYKRPPLPRVYQVCIDFAVAMRLTDAYNYLYL